MKGDFDRAEREAQLIEICGGIQPMHHIFYTRAIGFAASKAVLAFDAYRELLRQGKSAELIIFELQEALSHCAAISRFLWPVGKSKLAAARGQTLRKSLRVSEESPLKSRTLRNAIEHFDERMDEYLLNDPVGIIFDLLIESSDLADDELGHVFRLVDPEKNILVLFGEKYEFSLIEDEVRRIHSGKEI